MSRKATKQLGFVLTFCLSVMLSASVAAQTPRRACTQPLQDLIGRLNEIGISRPAWQTREDERHKRDEIENSIQVLIRTITHIIDVKLQKQQLNYTIQLYYLLRKHKMLMGQVDGMTEARFEIAFLNIDEAAQCMLEKL